MAEKKLGNIKGQDGNRGIQGIPGTNGTDGKDGNRGIPGTNGTDGKDGNRGIPGKDGNDGSRGLRGLQGIQGIPGESAIDESKTIDRVGYYYVEFSNGTAFISMDVEVSEMSYGTGTYDDPARSLAKRFTYDKPFNFKSAQASTTSKYVVLSTDGMNASIEISAMAVSGKARINRKIPVNVFIVGTVL